MGQNNDLGRATRVFWLLAALSFAGCGDENKTPSAKPERATATASASASIALAPSASAEASSSPSAEAVASASASAEPATATASESAAPNASGAPSSSPSASASARAKAAPPLPAAKNGILAAGAADKILKLGASPIVKLIDAGAEPREKISYAIPKGAEQNVEIAVEISTKTVGAGIDQKGDVPRMITLMALAAGETNEAGDALINGKLVKIGFEPEGSEQKQIADALAPELDKAKGLPMTYWITPRGRIRDLKMDATKFGAGAAQIVEGMKQSAESLVAPLPDEAIGIGASWQAIRRISSNGIDIVQYETYTLRKHNESKLGLDVSVAQLASSDRFGGDALPAGASIKILSFRSIGSGDREGDTKKLATDRSVLKMKTALELGVSQAGQPSQTMRVENNVTARFRKPK